eukprot:gene22168-26602_t
MNVRQKKLEMIEAMNRARALEPSSFVPNKLLDTLIEKMNLKNDAELCRVLEVQPPIISKIRHGKLSVGATILLRMHEKSDITIRELKELSATPVSLTAEHPSTIAKKPSPNLADRFCRPCRHALAATHLPLPLLPFRPPAAISRIDLI